MTEIHLNGRSCYGRRQFERDIVVFDTRLRGVAWKLTGHNDQADDLIQDTYVRALRHWEHFQPGTNLFAWLCTIMRNHFFSEKRRSWRMSPLDQEVAERTIRDPSVNQEQQLGFDQEFVAFVPLLGALPIEMRDSVVAIHYVGMKYEEAAIVLECEVGTIKSRVSRGLDALEKIISSEEQYIFDLSSWSQAARDIPKSHPFYPVAKAYEEIYQFLSTRGTRRPTHTEPKEVSDIDKHWRELIALESLEDDEDLDSLMRQDLEPY